MAVWQMPVFDRTAADLAVGDEKCCFSPRLLNRIEGNTEVLAGLFGVTGLQARQWQATDFLTAPEMQRILNGVAAVRDAYFALPGSPSLPQLPATHWQDVNAVEEIQWGLHELWQRNAAGLRAYTGEISAGQEIGVI